MATTGPLVTIMIPTYGQAEYLSDAIESALAQDYPWLDVLVIDDASPDATSEVVERYCEDERFRYVRNSQNLGRVLTYRSALYDHARGEFVLNLDGDDWLCDPSFISTATKVLTERSEVAMVFARAATYHETSNETFEGPANRGLAPVCDGTQLFLGYADGSVGIPHLAAVYRRALAMEVGFYQHDVVGADSVSFLLMLPGRAVGFVDRVVANWRRHTTNTSVNASVADMIANFAVADVPAIAVAARGILDTRSARTWRRRVSSRAGYRRIAGLLLCQRYRSAGLFLIEMLKTRPLATAEALYELGRTGLSSFTRRRSRRRG